jgi:hypothetical protein
VEERAGVVLPPEPGEREWLRMDPPNVLWFAGAYAPALSSYALLQTLPDTHKSVWILLAAIAFLLAYGAAARLLLRALWWVPGGLAAALAVAMVPAVCIGFLRLIGVWSSDFYTAIGLDDNRWTSALAVLAIGLSIFVLGMLLRRYGETWGERFVRRPPPNIAASP